MAKILTFGVNIPMERRDIELTKYGIDGDYEYTCKESPIPNLWKCDDPGSNIKEMREIKIIIE